MSKIVKYTEFKSVVDDLWGKVKNNFMTIANSSQFVSKVKPNVILEKTTILDGYIPGGKVSSVNNNPARVGHMRAGDFFIYKRFTVGAGTKISHIVIGVNENLNVGDTVTGVTVGYAKRTNVDNRIVVEKYVIQNGVASVHENKDTNLTCTKAITIEINDTPTSEVYLIVGCEGAIWGDKDSQHANPAYGGNPAPSVGSTINLTNGNWIGKAAAYTDGRSLNDIANSITTINDRLDTMVNSSEVSRGTATRVGEVITVLTADSNDFVSEGCTFMYMGSDRSLAATDYPQLVAALGLDSSVNNFSLPKIDDTTLGYENGSRTITQKSFICVKKA